MSRALRIIPAILLVLIVAAFVWRLANPPDSKIPSRLIGQKLPEFTLPPAVPGKPGLASSDFVTGGEPRLLNLFASWCVPCIAEAPILDRLHDRGIAIDGIAIRDRPQDTAEFLARHGDPFGRMGNDEGSQVQLALGSAGVPESFVVDGRGIIRYQHVGPILEEDVATILAELEKAQ